MFFQVYKLPDHPEIANVLKKFAMTPPEKSHFLKKCTLTHSGKQRA
jgi:hypothetical protein